MKTTSPFSLTLSGGRGSEGGKGRKCDRDRIDAFVVCYDRGSWDRRGPSGTPGINGQPGKGKIYCSLRVASRRGEGGGGG